ncbi:natural resistance-associated macrophage protein [Thermoanaerobacter italicus Ab9]|uniref:Natural resistance-associated macrophage protein n=1 Tax=Thermoanaerobacter italicus (strain DSM 9252 / Ab9) TaxID=580331 RepID=D3T7P3_THEIA|nr:Nramp family divalent metal transporter [Thermoanaerobacter italicus]ADD01975.1 natural resistance-associated macrophage protein [Thermoanaerobacter italicus Ab9]
MITKVKNLFKGNHRPKLMALDFIKYIGPGLLVTVGFIDPGNWASNVAAGSSYGYKLLWMVTLSTIMLIILQHNAAHLGIATGYCMSEAATKYLKPFTSRLVLVSAVLAAILTAMAEILGASIALQMLFNIPIKIGSLITLVFVSLMLYTNSYKKLEKWIIGFVSLIGISFIFELSLVDVKWAEVASSWVKPEFPGGSMPIIMSVLGAVVMPHNLFLHSEIIQSRQWNLEDEKVIVKQLNYEYFDTIFSMIIGWGINSAMIIVAASAFFTNNVTVTELNQAQQMLKPLLGNASAVVFALALLFAGISSSITAGMAGGSIFAGIYGEPYDIQDAHTKVGVGITYIFAVLIIFFVKSPFQGLVYSQMFLSVQLPITIFLLIYLTSSKKIMGKFANTLLYKVLLWTIGIIVTVLNVMLLMSFVG